MKHWFNIIDFRTLSTGGVEEHIIGILEKFPNALGVINGKHVNIPPPNSEFQYYNYLFFYLGFLAQAFMIHRTAGVREAISLTPIYHVHLLHRHLDISWAITAESSPLHIGSSQARTGNLWFPSTEVTNH